jgi:hypothetical protein
VGVERVERRSARTAFEGWVELTLGKARRLARGRDLSSQGLGLDLEAPHPAAGERVESEFTLPGFGLPLSVAARVAWSDPGAGRLGLCFESLDQSVAELLQSAVAGRFQSG